MKLKPLDKKWVKQYSNLEIACVMNMGDEWRGETKDGQPFVLREQSGIVGIALADTYYGLTKEIKLLCAKDKDWAKMIVDNDIDSEGNTDTDCNTRLSAQHTLGRLYFAVITSPSPFNNIAK